MSRARAWAHLWRQGPLRPSSCSAPTEKCALREPRIAHFFQRKKSRSSRAAPSPPRGGRADPSAASRANRATQAPRAAARAAHFPGHGSTGARPHFYSIRTRCPQCPHRNRRHASKPRSRDSARWRQIRGQDWQWRTASLTLVNPAGGMFKAIMHPPLPARCLPSASAC